MSKKKPDSDQKSSAPGYIVTFSDMITLLLTFFVMLLSMAETQVDQHRFERGIHSFRKAVADFGIAGILDHQSISSVFEHPKVYYPVDAGQDEPEDRSIDAHMETLRRALMDIEQMMTISPSHITGTEKTAFATPVRFADGRWDLSASDQQTLQRLSEQLAAGFSDQNPTVYVLGLAGDAPAARQWEVSVRRGQTVADFLRQQLPQQTDWAVFSWGAGPGGHWIGPDGPASSKTHILITVLTETR